MVHSCLRPLWTTWWAIRKSKNRGTACARRASARRKAFQVPPGFQGLSQVISRFYALPEIGATRSRPNKNTRLTRTASSAKPRSPRQSGVSTLHPASEQTRLLAWSLRDCVVHLCEVRVQIQIKGERTTFTHRQKRPAGAEGQQSALSIPQNLQTTCHLRVGNSSFPVNFLEVRYLGARVNFEGVE